MEFENPMDVDTDDYDSMNMANDLAVSEDCRLKGMCRICSASKSKLIAIFGDLGIKTAVMDLIHTYLPILVTPDDLLPISICGGCLTTLTASQTLVETCIEADKKLRQILDTRLSHHIQVNDKTEASPQTNSPGSSNFPITPTADKRRLYRCIHCTHTDTDAYALFLHQIKSHPENFLKCNKCEFVCSSDQKGKYEDHLEFHKSTVCREDYSCQTEENVDDPEELQNISSDDPALESVEKSSEGNNPAQNHAECQVHETSVTSNKTPQLEVDKTHGYSGKKYKESDKVVTKEEVAGDALTEGQFKQTASSADSCEISCSPNQLQEDQSEPCGGAKSEKSLEANNIPSLTFKKEIQWQCGHCKIKVTSQQNLLKHCLEYHKECLKSSTHSSSPDPEVMRRCLLCKQCKQTFSSELILKDHVCQKDGTFSKSGISPMSCLSCSSVFLDAAEFTQHLKTHNNSIQCEICKSYFRSKNFLKAHMKKHEEKPAFECPHCARVFSLRSRYLIHLRTHTGETPYMCVVCGKRFATDSGFRLHMKAHEGLKPYVCSKCGHQCNRPSNLRRHEASCRSEVHITCRICGDGFKTRDGLLRHRVKHTQEEQEGAQLSKHNIEEKFSCKVCNMKFEKVSDLSHHRKVTHTIAELDEAKKAGRVDGGSYVCPQCGKELYSKKNYDFHLLRHSGQAQHQCTICTNVYSTKFALDYHMYAHTGERPYECDICSEGFKSNLNLRVHRMKHTGERPFKCNQCNLGFFTTHSLRLHLVSHSEIRQYSCQYCPATFKRKRTLTTHIRVHTGEKPYGCRYCDKYFTQKGTCTLHERKHLNIKNPREKPSLKLRRESQRKVVVGPIPDVPCQHVAIIEDWNGPEAEADSSTATIGVLVAQDCGPALVITGNPSEGIEGEPTQQNVSLPNLTEQDENDGVQHMVLIHQDSNRDGSGEGMVVDEHMVLVNQDCIETTHAIIIGQDGACESQDTSSTVVVNTSGDEPQAILLP